MACLAAAAAGLVELPTGFTAQSTSTASAATQACDKLILLSLCLRQHASCAWHDKELIATV